MKKILIIRFSSIGDIVLASPVFRCIKNQMPEAEIHFLTKSSFKAVTQHNPYIDKFFYLQDDLTEIVENLKKENYDYVIDLHKNFRSLKVKQALKKVKSYTIKKLSFQKFLLTKLGINLMPKRHITLRSLDTVKPLGIVDDGKGLDYFISKLDEVKIDDLPLQHSAGYIALVIGASYKTKKLPIEKLKQLCNAIQHPIILLGGLEEYEDGKEIAKVDEIKIYNACGKFSLNESVDIVQKAKLVISHDTGLQYIACAYQKKVIAIWGATSPKLDVEPYYGSQQIAKYKNVMVPNLRCQPCSKYGTNTCPKGHFKCMNNINVNEIVNLVQTFLRS